MPVPPKRQALIGKDIIENSAPKPAMPEANGMLSREEGDKALAPLLSYNPSESDVETIKDFVKYVYREDYSKARALMDKLSDATAIKFARWYYYRNKAPDTEASELVAFLEENPRWPDRDKLETSIEDALFWREEDPKKIISYFAGKRPTSGLGLAALGKAFITENKADQGRALVREAWRKHPLTSAAEKKIRKLRFLNNEDHRARAAYLLMQDNKRYIGAVKRLLPLIDKKWEASIKARIATVRRSRSAGTLLTRLDKDIKKDPAVLFARIQWLRRADKDKKVWSLIRSAPQDPEKLIDPEEWWKEREIQVRLALNAGKPKTAYAIAKDHGGGLEHWDLSDAEFLAGWIALRFLNKPEEAQRHFLSAAAAGGLPKRRARASYWLGRTELVLHNRQGAIGRFAEAAQHHHTFYGQLAHQMIAETGAKVAFRTFVKPTQREIDAFNAQDAMRAIVLSQKADFENLMTVFLYDLAREIESAPEMVLLNELAIRVAPRHRAVRMAKVAVNRDFPVEHYAYPNALPEFDRLADGQNIENALVHALTRQESEFNPKIVSSAGAVGLMQLLPSTAKMVARWHDRKFSKKKLSDDPSYNVSLGTAFLHRLIRNYDGSYIMALAGYNAGPGRIRQWVKQFGDPRKSDVNPIDWIERIPFTETRDYVHKILESAQVYRSRLLGKQAPLRLAEDLYRGRTDKPVFMKVGGAD
jgi:soluble lytic murein transglycosylase